MPTRDKPWPAGTPNWIDIGVDDVDKAANFYSELFGWQVDAGSPETGGYRMATLDGRPVAGLAPKDQPNEQTWWNTYIATDDADATASAIVNAGGALVVEPMDVMTFGRMAVATDPNGAQFSIWQADQHIGCGVYNQPGAYVWNENLSTDQPKAQQFYSEVFGYTYESFDGLDDDSYACIIRQGGQGMQDCVGGIGSSAQLGGGNLWLVWFAVADTDATADKAGQLGGAVVQEPFESPVGRMAILKGVDGELFGVLTGASPQA